VHKFKMSVLLDAVDELGGLQDMDDETLATIGDAGVELALAAGLDSKEGHSLAKLLGLYAHASYTIGYHAGKGECSDSE